MRVLLVGGNTQVAEQVSLSLRLGWPDSTLIVVTTAAQGLAMAAEEPPNLVMLHLDSLDVPLSEMIRRLKRPPELPLLVLSQQGDATEVTRALELGADGYIRLPCSSGEMKARVLALVRRTGSGEAPAQGGRPRPAGSDCNPGPQA